MVDPELPELPEDLDDDLNLEPDNQTEEAELYNEGDLTFDDAEQREWESADSGASDTPLALEIDLSDEPTDIADSSSQHWSELNVDEYAISDAPSYEELGSGFEPVELMPEHLPTPIDGGPWSDASVIGVDPSTGNGYTALMPIANETELLDGLADEQYPDAQTLRSADDPVVSALAHHWLG